MKNNFTIGLLLSLLFLLLSIFLFSVKDVLSPFIFSFVVAYIVSPAVKWLQKIGCTKTVAVSIVIISLVALGMMLVVLIVPLAYYQSVSFINKIPDYIESMHFFYNHYIPEIDKYIPKEEIHKVGINLSANIVDNISTIISNVWSSGLVILSTIFFIFLTPIILFHASYEWENVTHIIKKLIPLAYYETVASELKNVDDTISGYIRGQTIVCIIAATYYIIAFTALKLQHGVFIGLISGILTFIPYVGSTFCFIASHLIAFSQFDNVFDICKITVAFSIEQVVEVAFLLPNLVGNKIKLHPLWVIFSIFAGGALAGFIGVLIALPVAATIGVIVRFIIQKYLSTDFYAGRTTGFNK